MQPHHLHELLETTFRGSTVLFRPWRSFHTSTCIKQWCSYCSKHWTSLGHLKTSCKFVNKRVTVTSVHSIGEKTYVASADGHTLFFSMTSLPPLCDITSCSLSRFLLLAWTVYHKLVKYRIEVLPCDVPIKKNVCVIFWKYDKVNCLKSHK